MPVQALLHENSGSIPLPISSVSAECSLEDSVMVMSLLTSGRFPEVDPSSVDSFQALESFLRTKDFLSSVSIGDLIPAVEMVACSTSSDSVCELSTLTNRAKWGAVFERLSIPFSRDVLLKSVSDRKCLKQILNDCFPLLVVESGFESCLRSPIRWERSEIPWSSC